jgi:hypothetical protein
VPVFGPTLTLNYKKNPAHPPPPPKQSSFPFSQKIPGTFLLKLYKKLLLMCGFLTLLQ